MKNLLLDQNKTLLFSLWIFLDLNYLFCDVFSLYYAPTLNMLLQGDIDNISLNQEVLFGFAVIMEVPLVMIIISKFANSKWSKISNIIATSVLLLLQIWSLSTGDNTLHYWFFSIIEIFTLLTIFIIACSYKTNNLDRLK